MTSRWCKPSLGGCDGFHDWEEMCPKLIGRSKPSSGPQIIKDIEPYKAMAGDIANQGKRPVIGGRAQHREFLKRNRYHEVGTEPMRDRPRDYGPEITHREIKQTIDQLRSRR